MKLSPEPKKLSEGEETMALHLRAAKIEFTREFAFHPSRGWRFDFLISGANGLAVEIDGGQRLAALGKDGKPYAVGRHSQDKDMEKLNEAAILGYRVLRFSAAMVKSGQALKCIERALA